ncbi:MAG: thermonuclease family protein [Candidatus Obscuribacterales bacterium]|nr:thermonuclease family protein [Candidatus Obscuribacterales bacterium]
MKNHAKHFLFFQLIILISWGSSVEAEIFSGKVIGVSDGDTITVSVDGVSRKVRLSGIDCPEKSQAYGQQAKAFTASKSFSKNVKVIASGHDRYKRTLGEVLLGDGQSLNKLLLQNGYAWWYERFSSDQEKRLLELEARKKKRGLWKDPKAAAPWDYRKSVKARVH